MEKTDFPYKFCAGEPGIFVEIYLPKKAKFQGTLYDSLTKAISTPKILKKYFTRNKSEILKLMKEDYPKLAENYNEIVNSMPDNIFLGYSMYEVDGVFVSNDNVTEERTQVIRIMFKYEKRKKYSTDLMNKIEFFLKCSKEIDLITKDEKEKKELLKVKNWTDHIALIIFGYLIFEICKHIKELEDNILCNKIKCNVFRNRIIKYSTDEEKSFLYSVYSEDEEKKYYLLNRRIKSIDRSRVIEILKKRKIKSTNQEKYEQDEIWITSFWNLGINRIILANKNEKKKRNKK